MENPEKRTFTANPLATVLHNRGAYIAACLTIARAYIAAGSPGRLTPLPSYEDWSNLIRSPLVWLGCADPVTTIEAARSTDPVRENRSAVFKSWRDELGIDQQFLAVELAERRYDYDQSLVRPALRAALLTVAAQRGNASQIDPRKLGIWLKKNENTIVGNHKLIVDRNDFHRPRWQLRPLENGGS